MSILGGMSNTSYPYAQQQGFVERSILQSIQAWDMDNRRQPFFHDWLPPAPTPKGDRDFEGDILIDPMGTAPLSQPDADPSMIGDYYAKSNWRVYVVKQGFGYDAMDLVGGHPELVNNRSRMIVEYNKRSIDRWTARFILKDPVAMSMFNPSGEYSSYAKEMTLTNGMDEAGTDLPGVIDEALARVEYEGETNPNQPPTLIVGPRGEKAIKNHESMAQYVKYWDRELFTSKKGIVRMGIRGVMVHKLLGGYKTGPTTEGNLAQATGSFQKATLVNKLRRFLMEDPTDATKECAIMIHGQAGNMRYAKTDPRYNNYGSGAGFIVGPVEDELHRKWKTYIEHAFCPCVENPFRVLIIRNFCKSWQDPSFPQNPFPSI